MTVGYAVDSGIKTPQRIHCDLAAAGPAVGSAADGDGLMDLLPSLALHSRSVVPGPSAPILGALQYRTW